MDTLPALSLPLRVYLVVLTFSGSSASEGTRHYQSNPSERSSNPNDEAVQDTVLSKQSTGQVIPAWGQSPRKWRDSSLMLLQPETRPISQQQLVNEVKGNLKSCVCPSAILTLLRHIFGADFGGKEMRGS